MAIREYAALQEQLCGALFDQHPIDDVRFLTDLPKHGALPVDDDLWEFQRHGTGVCFRRVRGNIVVDAHVDPVGYPAGVDACRLVQNLESAGIHSLNLGNAEFDATTERSVERLLQRLCNEGWLVASKTARHIYSLAE